MSWFAADGLRFAGEHSEMSDHATSTRPQTANCKPSAEFELAAGSVVGRDHLRAARNGHDAFHVESRDDVIAAVVCDGCGSAPDSEIGAKLGAAIVARALARCGGDWESAVAEIASRLQGIDAITPSSDSFFFTIVAAVIDPQQTTILVRGDGFFVINGERQSLGPFPGNAPPYFAYEPQLDVARVIETPAVDHIILGTDGAPMDESWTDDRYFANPDAVRRALFRMQPRDDATIVSLRRRA